MKESAVRVIARLDVKGPNLVKGIHLEGLRVLGDPSWFAHQYYLEQADELFYMDVVASLYQRNGLKQIISNTAKNVFIPITVGGGIRTIADINETLKAGADKVCINTAAHQRPNFIKEASLEFGSSTIVVAIETIKQPNGEYLAFVDNGREETGRDIFSWAEEVESLGAGEIVLTSVDREGTGEGFQLDIIEKMAKKVKIPIVAHGGAGKPLDCVLAVQSGASAVATASIIHYNMLERVVTNKLQTQSEGNTTFLESKKAFSKISGCNIVEIKKQLNAYGIECRTS